MRRAEAEALENMERSKAEAEGIVSNAETDARVIVEQAKREAHVEALKENREELSRARNEASRIMDAAKAGLVDRHLEAVWAQALKFRETEGYRSMMNYMADLAAQDLGEGCRLFCRKEDAGIISPRKPHGFIPCEGGLMVEDASGRIRLDGRMETLYDESRDMLSWRIYSHIFAGGR
ncbi:MAG: V-type ATP synthase subunit E family protein [Candidatus Altiarchaeota archaeon]